MAYFLKKSKLKKGVYLQIYESYYDSDKKQTAHKSYKALGYIWSRSVNISSGVPSRSLKVLRISFGITTLPRSSILLTIPVA